MPEEGIVSAVDADDPLRDPARAPRRGPRRLRLPRAAPRPSTSPTSPSGARSSTRVRGGHRAGAHRPRRQVHQPARRVPLGGRGAEARRLRVRREGRDRLDRGRRHRGPPRRRPPARPRRHRDPRRLRLPRHRGQDRRGRLRPRARRPVPRPLPRPALRGHRVRPRRVRPRRRELERVRPAHAAPGHRPDGRAARRRRHGRHDAPRRVPGEARCRARSCARRTAKRSSTSGTATATRSTTSYRRRLEEAGLVLLGHLARRPARRVRRAAARRTRSSSRTQAHPEFKSRPDRPHPLFAAFVQAARDRAEGRLPRLPLPIEPATRPRRGDRRATEFRVVGSEHARATPGSCRRRALRVAGPDGEEFDRHVVRHPGAVVVVPVDRRRRDPRAPVPRRGRARAARGARRASATSTASRPRRPRTASSRRRSGTAPAGSSKLCEFYNSPGFCDEYTLPVPRHRARGARRARRGRARRRRR